MAKLVAYNERELLLGEQNNNRDIDRYGAMIAREIQSELPLSSSSSFGVGSPSKTNCTDMEILSGLIKSVLEIVKGLKDDVNDIKGDVNELKGDVNELKVKVTAIEQNVTRKSKSSKSERLSNESDLSKEGSGSKASTLTSDADRTQNGNKDNSFDTGVTIVVASYPTSPHENKNNTSFDSALTKVLYDTSATTQKLFPSSNDDNESEVSYAFPKDNKLLAPDPEVKIFAKMANTFASAEDLFSHNAKRIASAEDTAKDIFSTKPQVASAEDTLFSPKGKGKGKREIESPVTARTTGNATLSSTEELSPSRARYWPPRKSSRRGMDG